MADRSCCKSNSGCCWKFTSELMHHVRRFATSITFQVVCWLQAEPPVWVTLPSPKAAPPQNQVWLRCWHSTLVCVIAPKETSLTHKQILVETVYLANQNVCGFLVHTNLNATDSDLARHEFLCCRIQNNTLHLQDYQEFLFTSKGTRMACVWFLCEVNNRFTHWCMLLWCLQKCTPTPPNDDRSSLFPHQWEFICSEELRPVLCEIQS